MLQVLPQTFIAPAAGVLNDRLSRRKLMIVRGLARARASRSDVVRAVDRLAWLLYVLLFLETLFWALFEPGRNSVIPNITSEPGRDAGCERAVVATWSFIVARIGDRRTAGGRFRPRCGICHQFAFFHRFGAADSSDAVQGAASRKCPAASCSRTRGLFADRGGIRYVRRDPTTAGHDVRQDRDGDSRGQLDHSADLWRADVSAWAATRKSAGMLGMSLLMCSRGIGALIGPLVAGRWSGHDDGSCGSAYVVAFVLASLGYLTVSWAPSLLIVCLAVALAHSGGSIAWVFSTTLLQKYTDDKFRGRVFSAEFAFMMATLSAVTFIGGTLVDAGLPVRSLAFAVGVLMLVPGLLWVFAQRLWKIERVAGIDSNRVVASKGRSRSYPPRATA